MEENKNKSKLTKTKIKQKVGGMLLGASLITGVAMNTGCAQITNMPEDLNEFENQTTEIVQNNADKNLDDEIQNLDFTVHYQGGGITLTNLFPINPDLNYETLNEDVKNALLNGATQVFYHGLNEFEESLQGHPLAQQYFSNYIKQRQSGLENATKGLDGDNDILPYVESATTTSYAILTDIIDHLPNNDDRVTFCTLFKLHYNEAYKNGSGFDNVSYVNSNYTDYFSSNAKLKNKYCNTINEALNYYNTNHSTGGTLRSETNALKTVDATQNEQFKQYEDPLYSNQHQYTTSLRNSISAQLREYLQMAAPELNADITINNLVDVVNHATLSGSLSGMDDYLTQAGYYKDNVSTINPAKHDLAELLIKYVNEKYLAKENTVDNERTM